MQNLSIINFLHSGRAKRICLSGNEIHVTDWTESQYPSDNGGVEGTGTAAEASSWGDAQQCCLRRSLSNSSPAPIWYFPYLIAQLTELLTFYPNMYEREHLDRREHQHNILFSKTENIKYNLLKLIYN